MMEKETRQQEEYDLVKGLLEAADYRTSSSTVSEEEVRRNGKLLFRVRIHPLGNDDFQTARKKATTYMPNPVNKKLPQIEKSFNDALYNSWVIYLATVEEDQSKVWGNKDIREKFSLALPVESIDVLLTAGEKGALINRIGEISGVDDEDEDELSDEDAAKK